MNNEDLEEGELISDSVRLDVEENGEVVKEKKKSKKSKTKNLMMNEDSSYDLKAAADSIEKIEKKVKLEGGKHMKRNRNDFVSSTYKTKPCEFYRKGACQRGNDCTYSHDFSVEKLEGICKYFLTGNCTKGEKCLFSHDLKKYPCKFFWGDGNCNSGLDCRFSHEIMTDRQKIMDFIQENESYFMSVYQARGQTNLGNYFLDFLQRKKEEKDAQAQHLLLPVTQEPQFQSQQPPFHHQQHNQFPMTQVGHPLPQDKQFYPGKQQFFDPNMRKQNFMPPMQPGQNFQGKPFVPQMQGPGPGGQMPPGNYGQFMQPVQGYPPQNPQFPPPQMPMNQMNPHYQQMNPPSQMQQLPPNQLHPQNMYQPQYQQKQPYQYQPQQHSQHPQHLQQHHQQQPQMRDPRDPRHKMPQHQQHPNMPPQQQQQYQPPHQYMQPSSHNLQGQMPPQMQNAHFPQMHEKPQEQNMQQVPQTNIQQNQAPIQMHGNMQPQMQQGPPGRQQYYPTYPRQGEGKAQPNFHQNENPSIPFSPYGVSQQSTGPNSVAQSFTPTPVSANIKEMSIEAPKKVGELAEISNPANTLLPQDIKNDNLQKRDEYTKKGNQVQVSDLKPPGTNIGENKISSEVKGAKELSPDKITRSQKQEKAEMEEEKNEDTDRMSRKSFWNVVKSKQRPNLPKNEQSQPGKKYQPPENKPIQPPPVIEKKPKEIPKNPIETKYFDQGKLLEKFGLPKGRSTRRLELNGDLDKLFSIFEFHSDTKNASLKSSRETINTPLKDTLKSLNELLASTE